MFPQTVRYCSVLRFRNQFQFLQLFQPIQDNVYRARNNKGVNREKVQLFFGLSGSRGQYVRHRSSTEPPSGVTHRRHRVRWCTWFHHRDSDDHPCQQHHQEQHARLKPSSNTSLESGKTQTENSHKRKSRPVTDNIINSYNFCLKSQIVYATPTSVKLPVELSSWKVCINTV